MVIIPYRSRGSMGAKADRLGGRFTSGGRDMKCAQCGADNPLGMRFCGMCGKLVEAPAVTPGETRMRHCVSCGRALAWDVNVCQYCGHDFRMRPKEQAKDQLVVGGVLTIVASVFSMVLTSIIVSAGGDLEGEALAMVVVLYSCAALGVMGGLMALAKMAFPLAVLGAACSIFGLAFFFGIPGLILIAKSSEQFRQAQDAPR